MRKIYSFMLMLLCATVSFAQMRVQGVLRQDVATQSDEPTSGGSKVDFGEITSWAGDGDNEAALVIKFNDGTSTKAYVWGYRWNGTASGDSMFRAVVKADPRLMLLTQQTNFQGTVAGIGYYPEGRASADLYFDKAGAMSDNRINFRYSSTQTPPSTSLGQTSYPEDDADALVTAAIEEGKKTGVIQHPFDHTHYGYSAYDYDYWKCCSGKHLWRAAWYNGYWSYWVTDNVKSDYTYSGLGFSSRQLQGGSVDGWSFVSDMNNWYSADMNNAELVYMDDYSESSLAAAKVATRAEEETKTYVVSTLDELRKTIESADFVEGSTIKFSDDVKGKEIENDNASTYHIEKSLTIDGNGVTFVGGEGGFLLYGAGKSFVIKNITFKNISGYAILFQKTSSLELTNCVFDGCDAGNYNAVVAINQDNKSAVNFNMTGCVFTNCKGQNGILYVKGYPSFNESKESNMNAAISSCTFVNNEAEYVLSLVNHPYLYVANNVLEGNKAENDIWVKKEQNIGRIRLVGYNVVKGTVNEYTKSEETDIIDAEQADNLELENGEYVVLPTGAAYNHLPANTVIEGVTFPEKDITGATIDYSKATHSGASQKVKGGESSVSGIATDAAGTIVYDLSGMRQADNKASLYKRGKALGGKSVKVVVK